METATWTLDELAELVGAALLGDPTGVDGYRGQPSGRVREVPDRRAIRWYTTIGLVDRPLAARGRGARYGLRHLRQIVAIKRRQAQGRSLAEIQAELAGADDATLAAIARLPEPPRPAIARLPEPPRPASGEVAALQPDGAGRGRFWAGGPPVRAADGPSASAAAVPPAGAGASPAPAGVPVAAAPAEPLLTGVPLAGGAILLLPATPGPDDLVAIAQAAGPLLAVLAERRLLHPPTLPKPAPPSTLPKPVPPPTLPKPSTLPKPAPPPPPTSHAASDDPATPADERRSVS